MGNQNLKGEFIDQTENKDKQDIFYRLLNVKNNKEKTRILESFWLNEKRNPDQNIGIIRKGIKILEKGTDKEKIIALQVISRTRGFPLSDSFNEVFGESSMKKKKEDETVNYSELRKIVDKCLELLTNKNGNLRFASARALHYLRMYISKSDSIEIHNKVKKLKDSIPEKKRKAIEYCLEKLSPFELDIPFEIGESNEAFGNILNEIDPEVREIWKNNENLAEELGEAYYDSVLNENRELIKKDTKENVGYNMFVDGIRMGLDIILPLLNEEMQEKAKEKIKQMLTKREIARNIKENIWSKGGYIKNIDSNDSDYEERMKYFEEKPNDPKEFNCKKCNKEIGKHNLYWHEEMCNDCFFDEYDM